jgi:hypothetical protein
MPEDIVRVLRILEYVGPRSWVEKTIAASSVKGERQISTNCVIREAVLGTFPEVVEANK